MRKKFTNHSARKTTVSKLKKALICCKFRIYRDRHRPQRYKFPQRLRLPQSWEKAKIIFNTGGSFRHYNNCGSTHPSMAASKENKLPPSFSGFKSQKFVHESSYDGVSGTDNDKQSLKILSKCLSSLAARSVLLI